jgi:hypothetical protein
MESVDEIPDLLRRLFALAECRTRKERMGKVALVDERRVRYYDTPRKQIRILNTPASK